MGKGGSGEVNWGMARASGDGRFLRLMPRRARVWAAFLAVAERWDLVRRELAERAWRESADTSLSMDQFEGRSAYVGVDLASKTDLGAVSLVFPDRDDHGRMSYSLFSICFTNEAAVIEARNPSYPGWSADGYLYVTSGNETDFAVIEDYIRDLCRRFDVRQVGYATPGRAPIWRNA